MFTAGSLVSCDGGRGGHPRVFLCPAADGWAECPYCGQRYRVDETGGTHGSEPAGSGSGLRELDTPLEKSHNVP